MGVGEGMSVMVDTVLNGLFKAQPGSQTSSAGSGPSFPSMSDQLINTQQSL